MLHRSLPGVIAAASMMYVALAGAAQGTHSSMGFPTRPVRIVVGFTPGGTPDITARAIAVKLGETLGQQVVVDNRPGAGGTVGTKIVADANPDGHTLLSISASHAIQPAIYAKLPYDTLRDFAGVTRTTASSYMLVV